MFKADVEFARDFYLLLNMFRVSLCVETAKIGSCDDTSRCWGMADAGIGLPYSEVSVKYISDHHVTLTIILLCVQKCLKIL